MDLNTAHVKREILEHTISLEGGYVNDPNDSGGETNYGITKATAKKYGYRGPMSSMPKSIALEIYEKMYWTPIHGDELLKASEAVCREVYDTGVNMGTRRAGEILQRCVNAFNKNEKLYKDLIVDGLIGPATINALKSYLRQREEIVILKALNCIQGEFYIRLSENRSKDEAFVYGWLKNRIEI